MYFFQAQINLAQLNSSFSGAARAPSRPKLKFTVYILKFKIYSLHLDEGETGFYMICLSGKIA
jgi:hypothetical protein